MLSRFWIFSYSRGIMCIISFRSIWVDCFIPVVVYLYFYQARDFSQLSLWLKKFILFTVFLFWIKGVNFIFRQFAKLAKPTWIITTNDNVYWTIEQTGGREQPPVTFKDREEFTRRSNLCLINFNQRLNLKLILYLVNQKHKMAI